jgi:hypothetical protein
VAADANGPADRPGREDRNLCHLGAIPVDHFRKLNDFYMATRVATIAFAGSRRNCAARPGRATL